MALPVIKVDSNSGSDTQASGAGPTTAVFGSTGVSAGDGLSVNLSADTPDLSGVATDGSACLFFDDTTAGARNFVKITGVDNGTKIVSVANALSLSATKAWAIGGKRASITGTTSRKLFENNGVAGDAMPGWTVELQSGHSETPASTLNMLRAGDLTSGPITLRGAAGAATLPLLTFSNAGSALSLSVQYLRLEAFELRNSNASKTSGYAITGGVQSNVTVIGIKIAHQTDCFYVGMSLAPGWVVRDCEVGWTAGYGIDFANNGNISVINCFIHDAGNYGINLFGGSWSGCRLIGCIIRHCSVGISIYHSGGATNTPTMFIGNIFADNTSHGLWFQSTTAGAYAGVLIINNDFSNNGGYGINISGSGVNNTFLWGSHFFLFNNNHYNNTSDSGHLVSLGTLTNEFDTTNIDPAYADAAGGDFSSTALKELGYPLGGSLPVGGYSSTYSYVDIGMQAHTAVGGLLAAVTRRRVWESKGVINF